jgi:hypothetical protein
MKRILIVVVVLSFVVLFAIVFVWGNIGYWFIGVVVVRGLLDELFVFLCMFVVVVEVGELSRELDCIKGGG